MIDYPQVALDFMNRDHAEFIALLEKLLDLLHKQAPDTEVDVILNEFVEHTRRHFNEEERHMQEAKFPPFPVHKMEHDRVLEDMQNRIAQWKQDRDSAALINYLEKAVIGWFVQHVGMMDFVTARYIAGKNPKN